MILRHLPLALIAALLVLAGCSSDAAVRKLATPEADGFAREFIVDVRDGNRADVQERVVREIAGDAALMDSVLSLARFFAPGRVQRVDLVDARVQWMEGRVSRELAYELRSDGGWTFVGVAVREEGGLRAIAGIQVVPLRTSVRETNAFTLAGTGPLHWLMLALAIAVPLFCLMVAVRVVRTPMRRRWAWALLAMVAGGKASLNWTTGEFSWMMVNAQLLGFAFQRNGVAGPWFLSVALPIGALIALQRVRRVRRALVDGARTGEASPSPIAETDVPHGDTNAGP